jgi:hypothetical protein
MRIADIVVIFIIATVNALVKPVYNSEQNLKEMRMRGLFKVLSRIFLSVLIAACAIWASLAIWFRLPASEILKAILGIGIISLAVYGTVGFSRRTRLLALLVFGAAMASILFWWSTITPLNQADWSPDVARQTTGSIYGNKLTLTNIRNFEWRSESDFIQRWETRTYDLSKLETVDLFMSYWAGPEMAHTIISFGFQDLGYLAWSIEVRRLNGSEFSPIADMFKSSPLVIIAADERDIIRLRTSVRHEDVQLYRLTASPLVARSLLLEYVQDANQLAQSAEFYNSITTNCTTAIVKMTRIIGINMPFDWRLIVNGYLPDYAYERGALDSRVSLPELKSSAHIGDRASKVQDPSNFSEAIRAGVPFPRGALSQ